MVQARIVPLNEAASAHAGAARLIAETWPKYYGGQAPGNARATIKGRAATRGLPFGLVALDDAGAPVGTVGLETHSFGAEHGEGPWIVGLAVAPDHRGQGIGSALVAEMTEVAARRGWPEVYTTTTETALFRRLGYAPLRKAADKTGGLWSVMQYVVPDRSVASTEPVTDHGAGT